MSTSSQAPHVRQIIEFLQISKSLKSANTARTPQISRENPQIAHRGCFGRFQKLELRTSELDVDFESGGPQ